MSHRSCKKQAVCQVSDNDAILIDDAMMTWPGFSFLLTQVQVSVFRWAGGWAAVNYSSFERTGFLLVLHTLWIIQSLWPNKHPLVLLSHRGPKGMQESHIMACRQCGMHLKDIYTQEGAMHWKDYMLWGCRRQTWSNKLKNNKMQHKEIPISHQCDLDFMVQTGTLLLWEKPCQFQKPHLWAAFSRFGQVLS